MKPTWKYIIRAFFGLLIIGYIIFSLYTFSGTGSGQVCKQMNITFLDISGVRLITERNVAEILQTNGLNPVGKTLKHIGTEAIETALRKNPMIKVAECYKTPSGIVNIRIKQRIPKFRIVGFGSYYIDTDRKPMPVSQNYAAYVPVVSGKVTVSMACGALFDFISFLEENPFWNAQIEQIHVRDDRKIELIPRVGDAVILLGDLTDYEAKLEKLKTLYAKGFNVMGWNRYKIIDLQYSGQVVCDKDSVPEMLPIVKTDSIEHKDTIIATKL